MRKLLLGLIVALLCLSFAVPAFAGHDPSPCNDHGEPGNSDYSLHHIVPLTANSTHVPGGHGGYSLCLDTGRSEHQP